MFRLPQFELVLTSCLQLCSPVSVGQWKTRKRNTREKGIKQKSGHSITISEKNDGIFVQSASYSQYKTREPLCCLLRRFIIRILSTLNSEAPLRTCMYYQREIPGLDSDTKQIQTVEQQSTERSFRERIGRRNQTARSHEIKRLQRSALAFRCAYGEAERKHTVSLSRT